MDEVYELAVLAAARTLIAEHGRRLREQHRLSLPEVAAVVGVYSQVVSSWERGESTPRKANALAYAALLLKLAAIEAPARELAGSEQL